jgi:MFS family permease
LLGKNGAMHGERESGEEAGSELLRLREWETSIFGLLVSLVIVGPTFLSEETWHGAPLIDRGGALWLLPAVVMAIGFFAGGMIAGYHRQRLAGALLKGVLVGALTIGLAFAGDLARRYWLGEGLQSRVLEYWAAAAVAALVVGGLGGVSGRYLAVRSWRRRQRASA